MDNEILRLAIENGMINLQEIECELEMKRRKECLARHPYKIWRGKDGKWYTYLLDESKPKKRKLLKRNDLDDLEEFLISLYGGELAKNITLEELYPEWLEYLSLHTNRSSSVKRYTIEWKRFYESDEIIKVPIESLDKLTLDKWVHGLIKQHQLSKKQYYTMSYIMRHCMEYAKERGYIEENVFAQLKLDTKLLRKQKKKRDETQVYLESEKPLIIEEAVKDFSKNPENMAPLAVILLFLLGLRSGEIVAIKSSDIEGDMIHIQRMEVGSFEMQDDGTFSRETLEVIEHTKTDAGDREIPLVDEARQLIQVIQDVNQRNGYHGEWLFINAGKRIHESAIVWRLRKYCNHLGIMYRSPHKIRKTVISAMIDADMNINTIRKIAGHEDERTTYGCYCFDRSGNTEIKRRMTVALKLSTEENSVAQFTDLLRKELQ